ncbi:MAG: hypothetical protein CMJ78_22615 [Planctomycetaceae bacterium]|nr:hypothetical protein [Planctomycetaceae bacterium]
MTNARGTLLERATDRLIKLRLPMLLIAIALTVPAGWLAQGLNFDQSVESLYAEDDPVLANYRFSKDLFGGDEFAIVAFEHPQLFDEKSALSETATDDINALVEKLNDIPGVQRTSTQSLTDALKVKFKREKIKELVRGTLLGPKDRTTAIILRLKPEAELTILREQTIAKIREVAANHQYVTYVAGEPVQVHDMFRYVEEDGSLLWAVSLVLLAVIIFTLFRNLRWVILLLFVVYATISWTEAILVISQIKLSMVSSMMNSLVTIIGVATVTHLTIHFRELRREQEPIDALRNTMVELAPAVFWTCCTTSIGFAALLSSEITPVRSFGVMMAMGTMLVIATVAAILPGGIMLGRRGVDPHSAPAEKHLVSLLERVTGWVEHHPKLLGFGSLAMVVFAGLGFFRLRVETDFSKNFRESSPTVQSLNFVEENLGGAGTWEVNIPAPKKLNEKYVDNIRQLAERIRTEFLGPGDGQLTKVICLTDGLDMVPKRALFMKLTLSGRLKTLRKFQSELESSLYNPEAGRMRLILRSRERQSSEKKLKLIAEVRRVADEEIAQWEDSDFLAESEPADSRVTGLFVLLAYIIESLLRDQLVSFCLAAVGIGAMMAVAFRSLRIGLISIIPNLFPIILVIGGMGWCGLPIYIATAMIASVSMGLTVDSSIHCLSGYYRARRQGLTVFESLHRTHTGVGRAVVFANLALIAGFSVLTLSHFIPLIYFGILVSVAMVGGLLGNLVLLPLLISWVEKDSDETAVESDDQNSDAER